MYDDIDSTLTVGNALDNRNVCNKTKWDSYKDERGRDIVEYTCEFKTDRPNQFLNQTFSGAISNLNAQLVDKDITITLESYQKFRIEEEQNKYVKHPNYTLYRNYVDAGAVKSIYSKAQLLVFDKLKQALNEIERSDAFTRYQANRSYFIEHRDYVENSIREDLKYNVNEIIDYIYSENKESLIGKLTWNTRISNSLDWNLKPINGLKDQSIKVKIDEILEDTKKFKTVLETYQLYFSDDFSIPSRKDVMDLFRRNIMDYKDSLLKMNKDGLMDIGYNQKSRDLYLFFLEGKNTKIRSVGLEGYSDYISFNNYHELFSYLEGEEQRYLGVLEETIIDPYNQNLTNEINRFEKLSKDIKTESYQQKIKWALIGEREPSLMSCELEFKADGYSSVKSDSSMTSSCFQVAYKNDYVDQIYNQPVMHFINQVTR